VKKPFVRRLQRLLVLIPFVRKHGASGVSVDKAAEFAGCKDVKELYEDIELLQQIAVPPGAPDDMVEVYLEGGRVYVDLPLAFEKPPRLTVAEAAALIAATRPVAGAAGKALDSALAKLGKALPPGAGAEVAQLARAEAIEAPEPPPCRAALIEAIERRLEVEVDYYAQSAGAAATRTLEPRSVFLHGGHWYLAAWNPQRGAEHLYRLDRISEARLGTRSFGEHKGPALGRYDTDRLYFASGVEREVSVRFAPALAELVEERWSDSAAVGPDGSLTVRAELSGENYALSWVMGYGGEAEIVSPPALRAALAQRVAALRALYAGDAPQEG
jgi:proteasome accessory factor C